MPAKTAIDAGDIVDTKSPLGYFFWKRALRQGLVGCSAMMYYGAACR